MGLGPELLIGTMIGATAVGTISAYAQQDAANIANEYNARILEHNAQMAELEAESIKKRGSYEEMQHRLRVRALRAAQIVSFAASGVDVSAGGTPSDVLMDTTRLGEMDAMTIRYNAALQAWSKRHQAVTYRGQAGLLRAQKVSPVYAGAISLLGGASQLASTYMGVKSLYPGSALQTSMPIMV